MSENFPRGIKIGVIVLICLVVVAIVLLIANIAISSKCKTEYATDMAVVVKKDSGGDIMTLIDSYIPDKVTESERSDNFTDAADGHPTLDGRDEQIEVMNAYRHSKNGKEAMRVRKSGSVTGVSRDAFIGSVSAPVTTDFYANSAEDLPPSVTATSRNVERS